jgi:ferredoxin-thioredoxin reductase catalytic subunit
MNIQKLRKVFEKFCENNDFQLNPNKEHTDTTLKGVLENEEKTGLKFCPCQIQTGDFSRDIKLLCPCNFKIQKTWKEKGECWCGLFVKK